MKNKQKPFGGMIFFMLVFAAGCSPVADKTMTEDKGVSDGNPYSSQRSQVTVTVPAGWKIKESFDKVSDKVRFDSPQSGGGAVLQIERFKQTLDRPDGAVDWFVFRTIKAGTSPDAKLEFLNEGLSKLRGLPVYAADLKNSTMTGRILCFYKRGHQYKITYFVVRTPQSNAMNATIKSVLNTVEFL